MLHTIKLLLFIACLLLLDRYVLSGLRCISKKWRWFHRENFTRKYWTVTISIVIGALLVIYIKVGFAVRMVLLILFFVTYLCKLSYAVFLLADDVRRLFIYLLGRGKKPAAEKPADAHAIPRSEFLVQAGLLAGAVPLAAIGLNMQSGLYDYHVKR